MTKLITKIKSALSIAVLFATATCMIGLGFAFVGTIALFGLVAVGVTMMASPFVTRPLRCLSEELSAGFMRRL